MVNWHKRQLKLWAVQFFWSRETSKNPRPWNPARSKASDDFFRERIDSSGVDAYTNRLN